MEYRLLKIKSCLNCYYCSQQKKNDEYTGLCCHPEFFFQSGLFDDLFPSLHFYRKELWKTGITQCVVGRIPDWCPLENAQEND